MRGIFFLSVVGLIASQASASPGWSFIDGSDTTVHIQNTYTGKSLVVDGPATLTGTVEVSGGDLVVTNTSQGISVTGMYSGVAASATGGPGVHATGGSGGWSGVYGQSDIGNGVHGVATDEEGTGVRGEATQYNGIGVHGTGEYQGVYGYASRYGGYGVRGEAPYWYSNGVSGSSEYIGVYGTSSYYTGIEGWGAQVGVSGRSNEDYATGVYGDATGTGAYAGVFNGDVAVYGDCDPCSPSDGRFKKNIQSLRGGLDKIMALKPKTYEMKTDEFKGVMNFTKGTKYGLLAEELAEVMPELVHAIRTPAKLDAQGRVEKNGKRDEYQAISYSRLIPILISAIQEQQAEIEALKKGR